MSNLAAPQSQPDVLGLSAPDENADAGRLIAGKYRLRSVIGEGGMGAVWLARNEVLAIDVAIKLIHRAAASPSASARLEQEAQSAARLAHPSIVRVFDFGTDEGDPFIVMELLRGESLGDLLTRRGRVSAVDAVRLVIPVLRALEHAHAAGIVHRDLKPDNILIVEEPDGTSTPKVVDFGIAKLRRDDVNRALTMDGTLLGTPDYMSPAQARGAADVDDGADIWAMSVVLYEMLVGQRPFEGANYNALLNSILSDEPAPTTRFAAGDAELWDIIATGLAKKREDRWPNIGVMANALSAWCLARDVATDVTGALLVGRGRESRVSISGPPSLRGVDLASMAVGPVTLQEAPKVVVTGERLPITAETLPNRISVTSWPPEARISVPSSPPPDLSMSGTHGRLSTGGLTPRTIPPVGAPRSRRSSLAIGVVAASLAAVAITVLGLARRAPDSPAVPAGASAPPVVLAPVADVPRDVPSAVAAAPSATAAPEAPRATQPVAGRKTERVRKGAPPAAAPEPAAPAPPPAPMRAIPAEPNF